MSTTSAKIFTASDPDPDLGSGSIVAVNYGDYRQQEIWVASGANIGNWYPLGGEFGVPKVAEDPRPYAEQITSRTPWKRPPGTIPQHPHWGDIVARGPVTVLVPSAADAYAGGWKSGRKRLCEQVEDLRDEEDVPPGYGWRHMEET